MAQLEQLLRNLPGGHKIAVNHVDVEEENENNFGGFAGMISCCYAKNTEWIIDSGASDHITGNIACVSDPKPVKTPHRVNLSNGESSVISHCGSVALENGLILRDVLVVPAFKHSLLSVKKLIDTENCKVNFYPDWCIIVHNESQRVKGLGKSKDGLYYLLNQQLNTVIGDMSHTVNTSVQVNHGCIEADELSDTFLWHLRLGQTSAPRCCE